MSGIDERVVEMKFLNSDFVKNVSGTVSALDKLKSSLQLKGATDGLDNLDAAGKRFSLAGIASGVETVASKFSALSIIGISALASITSRAVNAGVDLVKSFTLDPIKEGFDVYETKINAIQTILANTAAAGSKMSDVTAALNNLNKYANLTVYNFGEMAHNLGTFTAAGIALKPATEAIKGIANLAALSGSSSNQASEAMYQLSQALAAGKVKLQDWNSVVNAGLGGKVFQTALEETAKASGVAIDSIVKKAGGFRNSLQQGWLTSQILTKTLETFTGDLSTAQLKAMGFTAQEAAAMEKVGQTALNSATKIRTISALTEAWKEEVATAWSTVFQAIIGQSVDATTILSTLHNVGETALTKPIYALSNFLDEFDKLGGRDLLIQSVEQAFGDLAKVLKVLQSAFEDVFSGAGGSGQGSAVQGIIALTVAINNLFVKLDPSAKTLAELKTIFEGIFSAVKIVVDVIGALIGGLTKVGSAAGSSGASGGFLSFLASIASFIISARKAIESGTALKTFFDTVGKVIAVPVKIIGSLIGALGGFAGAGAKAASSVTPFIQKIADVFSHLGSAIINGIKSGDLAGIGSTINQLLLGGVLIAIRNFIKGLGKGSDGEGGGLFSTIKESFESLTTTLKTMQQTLKAGTLLLIASAIALIAAAVVAISLINVAALTKALTAISLMFTELLIAMNIVAKISNSGGFVKMALIAVDLNLLATSILLLSGAVAILAQFSWEQLGKGLGTIAGLLLVVVASMAVMSRNNSGVLRSAVALDALATALNIMAGAVALLGHMSWTTLERGVGTIAALLLVVAGFQKIGGGPKLLSSAASLVILGAALNVIALAVAQMGKLPLGEIAKGVGAIAAALALIGIAMNLMPISMPITAAGLVIVSGALLVMSKVLSNLGGLSWGEIAKGLVTLAGALVLIAAATIAMTGALGGAAAIAVVAGALALLVPIFKALGGMSWSSILTGLGALAGIFTVLGLAGLLLTPLVPALLGIGAAVALIGIGMAAAGGGLLLFSAGLGALAVSSTALVAAVSIAVKAFTGLIPSVAAAVGKAIVSFAAVIGKDAPALVNAIVKLLLALLSGIIKVTPQLVRAFETLLNGFLNIIRNESPKIISTFLGVLLNLLKQIAGKAGAFATAGANIVVAFFNGIARNVGRMVTAAADIVIAFIKGVGSNALRIAQAGANMIINFINGLADTIRADTPRLRAAGLNLALALIDGMTLGLSSDIGGLIGSAVNLGSKVLSTLGAALHIGSPSKATIAMGGFLLAGLGVGLVKYLSSATTPAAQAGTSVLDTFAKTLSGINDTVKDNLDLQPKITPILDLTKAKQGFNDLGTLSKAQLIAATATTNMATSVSAANAAAVTNGTSVTPASSLTFIQNNTSPAALSTADIYRQTKNQLSVMKGALPTSANKS
jgi:tape measure domain-containing protein